MSVSNPGQSVFPSPLVETDWTSEHLFDPDLRILDCSVFIQYREKATPLFVSGKEQWQQAHIPGSQFIDVINELSDPQQSVNMMMPPVDEFMEIMAEHGIGTGTKVVLYDALNNIWAARVWWMLRVSGFDDAAVLNGGWKKWIAEGRVTATDTVTYPKGYFKPKPRPELMASKQQVLASLNDEKKCIINALSPDVFNGNMQLFPRPGRIPGSKNVYAHALVDTETNAFIEVDSIKALFKSTGALQSEQVITYCGGGIAASGDALALVLIGMDNVSVYDGSMSEWTADPDMPLETN